jgi:hypothetical protein
LISFFIFTLLASSAVLVRRSVIAELFNSSFEEILFSFQDKSRSVLVSDDARATTLFLLLLILIRDDGDDEFKFVRGIIFSQPFFAATTTREQQRGVLIIDGDEEETEEEEIMLLMMMMMPCALYRYIQRERKSEKLFFPLEYSKSRSRALNEWRDF